VALPLSETLLELTLWNGQQLHHHVSFYHLCPETYSPSTAFSPLGKEKSNTGPFPLNRRGGGGCGTWGI